MVHNKFQMVNGNLLYQKPSILNLCKKESQVKSKKWLLVRKVNKKSKNIDFFLTFLD